MGLRFLSKHVVELEQWRILVPNRKPCKMPAIIKGTCFNPTKLPVQHTHIIKGTCFNPTKLPVQHTPASKQSHDLSGTLAAVQTKPHLVLEL